mgnify:CR=1 FL=1
MGEVYPTIPPNESNQIIPSRLTTTLEFTANPVSRL